MTKIDLTKYIVILDNDNVGHGEHTDAWLVGPFPDEETRVKYLDRQYEIDMRIVGGFGGYPSKAWAAELTEICDPDEEDDDGLDDPAPD